jgi:hypothetical protein
MMLMNFETNDKYCFCSCILLVCIFCSNIYTNHIFFEIGFCCVARVSSKPRWGSFFETILPLGADSLSC